VGKGRKEKREVEKVVSSTLVVLLRCRKSLEKKGTEVWGWGVVVWSNLESRRTDGGIGVERGEMVNYSQKKRN